MNRLNKGYSTRAEKGIVLKLHVKVLLFESEIMQAAGV